MLSFRVPPDDAALLQTWARRLDVGRSELLRTALHRHLRRLESEVDAETWAEQPLTADEAAIGEIADWGPAEDWSDWQ